MAVAPTTATDLIHKIFDLQRVLRCITVAQVPRGGAGGVGLALQGVLRMIGEGEARATNFVERLGVSAPVLSRHIAELEDLGLVARRPDPDDGRAQLVALTEAGAAALQAFEDERTARLQEYLADWSEEDALEASEMLKKLAGSLKDSFRATTAGATHTKTTV
jgi:DNA-binding MarR family transcriptional regulator